MSKRSKRGKNAPNIPKKKGKNVKKVQYDYLSLFNENKNKDFSIIFTTKDSKNLKLTCHRSILAQSEYLKEIMVGKKSYEEKIEQCSLDMLKFITWYFYGKEKLTQSQIKKFSKMLGILAKKWKLDELEKFITSKQKSISAYDILENYVHTKMFKETLDENNDVKSYTNFCLLSNDGGEINVHREILIVASKFFGNLLVTNEKKKSFRLDLSLLELRVIVNFIYRKEIDDIITQKLSFENFMNLLKVVSKIKVDSFEDTLVKKLQSHITEENAIDAYFCLFDKYGSEVKSVCENKLRRVFGSESVLKSFILGVKKDKEREKNLSIPQEIQNLSFLKKEVEISKIKVEKKIKKAQEEIKEKKRILKGKIENNQNEMKIEQDKNAEIQMRISKLADIEKKEKLLKKKEDKLAAVKDKKTIYDLEDEISSLKGQIFVLKEKYYRYTRELQGTNVKLLELFETQKKLQTRKERLEESQMELNNYSKKFNKVQNKDYLIHHDDVTV